MTMAEGLQLNVRAPKMAARQQPNLPLVWKCLCRLTGCVFSLSAGLVGYLNESKSQIREFCGRKFNNRNVTQEMQFPFFKNFTEKKKKIAPWQKKPQQQLKTKATLWRVNTWCISQTSAQQNWHLPKVHLEQSKNNNKKTPQPPF